MSEKCQIRIARDDFEQLKRHLFPGDGDEHGAVLLAGISHRNDRLTLHVRELHVAGEGVDYVEGKIGYRALHPSFIHKLITRARDERLAYLAVHNHEADRDVTFSQIDLQSHERGYPALLQIAKGMPVGAVVVGHRSIQADVWNTDGSRLELDEAVIVGCTIQRLTPSPRRSAAAGTAAMFDRQIRMFGHAGQMELARCHVGIVGLGGIGSIVAECLARLGVGHFQLVDNDVVEESNLSRVVGASLSDATEQNTKVDVVTRTILQANPNARVQTIADDVAKESVAKRLTVNDYIFLAADCAASTTFAGGDNYFCRRRVSKRA
jgi:ThiF family